MMSFLLSIGLPDKDIAQVIGRNPETVRLWKRQFALMVEVK